jgi:uncharacterized protein YmfQ (DUF2313 family)
MDELKIEVAEALIVKPGDRVLLLLKEHSGWSMETVERANALLKERFPDTTFAFVSDIEKAVVAPPPVVAASDLDQLEG